jgi:hypothetical protein
MTENMPGHVFRHPYGTIRKLEQDAPSQSALRQKWTLANQRLFHEQQLAEPVRVVRVRL